MGDQDDRYTELVDFLKKIHDLGIVPEILSGGRLIQDQDLRTEDENGGDGHPFLLPVTEGGDRPGSEGTQAADFQDFLNALLNFIFGTFLKRSPRAISSNIKLLEIIWLGFCRDNADDLGPFLDGHIFNIFAVITDDAFVYLLEAAD